MRTQGSNLFVQLQKILFKVIRSSKKNAPMISVLKNSAAKNVVVSISIALCTLALLNTSFAIADTNAAGVEINVANDIDFSTYAIDPVQSYLPETSTAQPNTTIPSGSMLNASSPHQ